MYLIIIFSLFTLTSTVGFCSSEIKFEESIEKYQFIVRNALLDGTRFFQGEGEETIESNLEKVLVQVLDFSGRCNQDYASRREQTSKDDKCRFHNQSMIESVIIREYKYPKREKKLLDEFILWRNVFNKNVWQYYDYVTVEQLDSKNIRVHFEMMSEAEVKNYIENPKKVDAAFKTTGGEFLITSLGKNKTKVKFTYFSSTDHWLLSSGMAKGQIVEKIAEGSRRTLDSIKEGSTKF